MTAKLIKSSSILIFTAASRSDRLRGPQLAR